MVSDYKHLFEAIPSLYLVLSPDLTIIGATDTYLAATLTRREDIIGKGLFDVFPDNPDDIAADGVSNLQASLNTVLQRKKPHMMTVQKYDIRRPDGSFEERYWSPVNSPVLNDRNELTCIIHQVEDVTSYELAKKKERIQAEQTESQLKASEDRFTKIFDLSPVASYVVGFDDRRFIQVNRAFEKLTMYSAAQVIGKTVVEAGLIDEKKREELTGKIREVGGRANDLEMELVRGDGEVRNMLLSIEIIEMEQKKCFLVAMVDITKRKETENALKQTNNFLDTVLENIPDMVFVKNAKDLRFIRFNKAGEDILGYSKNDLIGKNDYDFFPQEEADFFTAKDREVFEGKTMVNIEEEPIQTSSGRRWLHTKKIPVFENGEPAYLVGISEDITVRKEHKDAILQLNKELEAFTYSVSHDLRAPLRAMTGYAKMLEEDYGHVLDAEGVRQLGVISDNAEKMGILIDELLSFSHIGRRDLHKTTTDMNSLVANAVREVNRSVTHNADIKVRDLHAIEADPMLMTQVLVNLISNAIKYSAKKEKPEVEIYSECDGDNTVFFVKDNGAGFDMRYVNKLFGVFQRLHARDEYEGTGVGLAIVQRVISKHGGAVSAVGRLDEGAVFSFSIPAFKK